MPRKHIKIRGELINNNTAVKVTILEQTHRRDAFGELGGKTPARVPSSFEGQVFVHNGIVLFSYLEPYYSLYSFNGLKWFYLQGSRTSGDAIAAVISLEEWEQVKEAVEAYNEFYKEEGDAYYP